MTKKYIKYIIALGLLVVLYVGGLFWASTKLTYLEYVTANEKCNTYVALDKNEDSLRQEFVMPYEILESVAFQVGTYEKENDSAWIFSITDSSGKVVYQDKFNAKELKDNSYYRHELKGKTRVDKGETYRFEIKAEKVSDSTKIAFYASDGNNLTGTTLSHNGLIIDNTLCFKVYGGDGSAWWYCLVTFGFLYAFGVLARIFFLEKQGKSIIRDTLLQGLVLGGAIFFMLCSFATQGVFTDESDNIRGGMVIANGGILYRDYVVQHPPLAYYLCGIFALFGAGSIEQFRLAYYIVIALIWGLLYVRHKKRFGAIKMLLLPIVIITCSTTIIAPQGWQILSDGLQALSLTALLLEFIGYYEDKRLNWIRCVIVSLCVWGCIGSAFVSLYALAFVALIFIVVEILYLIKNKTSFKGIVKRYYKLLIALIAPLIIAIFYFGINGALGAAFEQIYKFNRAVYPKYIDGPGAETIKPFVCSIGSPISPFINSVQNFFILIATDFKTLFGGTATLATVIAVILILLAVAVIVRTFIEKKIVIALALTCAMIFSATRGYNFHGLAAWYVMIMIIVLYADLYKGFLKKAGTPVLCVALTGLACVFFLSIGKNLAYKQESVTELESRVVQMTEDDENKEIFHDAFRIDSIYLYYKGRKPINRAVYMLPWYMEWYESADVADLIDKTPRVVVYDEDRETWGMTHYTNAFDNELKARYTRLGDSGWQYKVWIRND